MASRLGFNHWSAANKLIHRMKDEKDVDIRSTDDQYHCKIKTGAGKISITRKWSHKSVALLKKVSSGLDYEIDL